MSGRIGDQELGRMMVDELGPRRSVVLVGWCALAALAAPKEADRGWLLEHGPGSRSTRYVHLADLERVARRVREAGLVLDDAPLETDWARLARRGGVAYER